MVELGTMDNGFKFLRSKSTGHTGYYPAHFLDFADLELAEEDDCKDCVVAPDPEPTETGDRLVILDTDTQKTKVKR